MAKHSKAGRNLEKCKRYKAEDRKRKNHERRMAKIASGFKKV